MENNDMECGRRNYDDFNWQGYITAKVETHETDIQNLKSCAEIKNQKIITSDVAIKNLQQNFETHVVNAEKWQKDFMKVFADIHNQLTQIKFMFAGVSATLIFLFFVFEKIPAIISGIEKLIN